MANRLVRWQNVATVTPRMETEFNQMLKFENQYLKDTRLRSAERQHHPRAKRKMRTRIRVASCNLSTGAYDSFSIRTRLRK